MFGIKKKPKIIKAHNLNLVLGRLQFDMTPKEFDELFGGYTIVQQDNGDIWSIYQIGCDFYKVIRQKPTR